ncbi:hypothetical protein [Leptolyngbya sp. GGD]|uniref:hypothetical protein n=1 Tax=Leptolyngbya sp. GGD TaxID=2997907 RepID=UPI00227ACF3B|nr:hypothetical protein [Leptolyngbya sp. GGD]MCY6492153.1 hypothetical protein [Leptolyngbya sp. GGD]
MEAWQLEAIRKLESEYGTVPPPWVVFNEHPYSLCWRMGGGEAHIEVWSDWWEEKDYSEAEKIEYFRQWKPPASWLEWMIDAIWEPADTDEEELANFARAEALGFGSKAEFDRAISDPKWLEADEVF